VLKASYRKPLSQLQFSLLFHLDLLFLFLRKTIEQIQSCCWNAVGLSLPGATPNPLSTGPPLSLSIIYWLLFGAVVTTGADFGAAFRPTNNNKRTHGPNWNQRLGGSLKTRKKSNPQLHRKIDFMLYFTIFNMNFNSPSIYKVFKYYIKC